MDAQWHIERSENNCVVASPLLLGIDQRLYDLQSGLTNPFFLSFYFISLSQLPLILVKIIF